MLQVLLTERLPLHVPPVEGLSLLEPRACLLVGADIEQIQLYRPQAAIFVDLRRIGDIDHISQRHSGQPRGRGEKDAVKMVAMPGQAQPQMLAAADLGKIGHGHIAHVKHRPRTARPAGLELI